MKSGFLKVVFLLAVLAMPRICPAEDPGPGATMLMFVGEDSDVLSIASGREEGAWQAPAIATVFESSSFKKTHKETLAELLDSVTGFQVYDTGSGARSYARGIPEALLYLYDTVPMNSAANKRLNLIDDELSLHSVKRVEVIRGPGSVLWGPDAFAGIVNVVPMTGRDLNGSEAGLLYNSKDSKTGAYLNTGVDKGAWCGFFSMSASRTETEDFSSDVTRFWGSDDASVPVPVDDRTGSDHETGQYLEMSGNFIANDFFTLSGRITDSTRPYSIENLEEGVSWKEVESATTGFLKLEGKKQFALDSALRFIGTVSMLDHTTTIIDRNLDQEEFSTYGEAIYEKAFDSGRSLLTAGVSFRRVVNQGVPVWDFYFPGYVTPDNELFLPNFEQDDYTTNLWSFFTQYRMGVGDFDFLLGVRHDEHDSFDDKLSFNTGFIWSPREVWVCKFLLGTAYRTPTAKQLLNKMDTSLEEINSINLESSWKFQGKGSFSVVGFANRISNHIMDDPYAGLSNPNTQTLKGVELELKVTPLARLSVSANVALLEHSGPSDVYTYCDGYIWNPDNGNIEKNFVDIECPYDIGPDRIVNLHTVWTPVDRIDLFAQLRYRSGYQVSYPHEEGEGSIDGTLLVNAGITVRDCFLKNGDLRITFKNLFDTDYSVPGTYSLEKGEPMSLGVVWSWKW